VQSFFWHDYETFGADPVRDRPSQFAGVRTDADLNIIGEPVTIYCAPSEDYVPDPVACLITGITPQAAREKGLVEAEFIARVLEELGQPGTCGVGYNSLRFDDEVTRHTLFRNLRDPYAREWQNGNSRWDIIDMVRLTHALRPEGIEWPRRDDGLPSFRLEHLTAANGLVHEAAHDAMSDVYATIEVARLIRQRQPRLFDYVVSHRDKASARAMLNVHAMKPVFHVSSRFPASVGCSAMVAPIAPHPDNPNAVIVYDLRADPRPLIEGSEDDIRERVFTRAEDLEEGAERIPLKAVHVNRCPVLAPAAMLKTLSGERLAALDLDGDRLRRHLDMLRSAPGLAGRVAAAFRRESAESIPDPDESLYAGGFIGPADRKQLNDILRQPPEVLGELSPEFQDSRLSEMFFRYRARNYPQTLQAEEQARWEAFRQKRLLQPGEGWRALPAYLQQLQQRLADESLASDERDILEQLYFWGESLIPYD